MSDYVILDYLPRDGVLGNLQSKKQSEFHVICRTYNARFIGQSVLLPLKCLKIGLHFLVLSLSLSLPGVLLKPSRPSEPCAPTKFSRYRRRKSVEITLNLSKYEVCLLDHREPCQYLAGHFRSYSAHTCNWFNFKLFRNISDILSARADRLHWSPMVVLATHTSVPLSFKLGERALQTLQWKICNRTFFSRNFLLESVRSEACKFEKREPIEPLKLFTWFPRI